ncbi:MAG: TatD family hydrolase [Longimicrobiales bacterium]
MYFDSHCHLTDERFVGEASTVAERAREVGVDRFVIIGSNEEDSEKALGIAGELELWSTAGIHPHEATRHATGFDRVRELVETEERVVAIGETGLDYYYDNSPRRIQRKSFDGHLQLAAELGTPVVVHSRDADADTISMIRAAGDAVTGVLHCFAGAPALFEAGVAAGWYVSFSGLVTFRTYETKSLVAETPADRLLIETDAPYLAPVPHRGSRNEPAYVVDVARAVAELREEPLETVAEQTTRNALTFYQLD